MSETRKKEITTHDLREAIVAEQKLVLEENREKILHRAFKELRKKFDLRKEPKT